MAVVKRNYRKEYRLYQSSPKAKKERAHRNAARNAALKKGVVSKGDGYDIDHKDGNPLNNSKGNVRKVKRGFNRGRNNNKWRKS